MGLFFKGLQCCHCKRIKKTKKIKNKTTLDGHVLFCKFLKPKVKPIGHFPLTAVLNLARFGVAVPYYANEPLLTHPPPTADCTNVSYK